MTKQLGVVGEHDPAEAAADRVANEVATSNCSPVDVGKVPAATLAPYRIRWRLEGRHRRVKTPQPGRDLAQRVVEVNPRGPWASTADRFTRKEGQGLTTELVQAERTGRPVEPGVA